MIFAESRSFILPVQDELLLPVAQFVLAQSWEELDNGGQPVPRQLEARGHALSDERRQMRRNPSKRRRERSDAQ